MLAFLFHWGRKRKSDEKPERTMLQISIGFKRVPIDEHDSAMEERRKEMEHHPAFARSKRFLPTLPPASKTGLK